MLIEKFYENLEKIHVNTCPIRSYYVPCEENSVTEIMENSSRVTMLSGDDWKFKLYNNPYEIKPFFEENFAENGFDTIAVPSCWQILGYEPHAYLNVQYPIPYDPPFVPDENLSGAYIKHFTLSEEKATMKNYLNFEGVDSCLYVWVNGKFVGYSTVSHSTSEFDITNFVKAGENKLAVLVLKWCTGTYIEDQDKLRMNGIFRDTYIISRPQNHIFDYYVKTTLDESYKNGLISITCDWVGEILPTKVALYSPSGDFIEEKELAENKTSFKIENATLWTAETPFQYTVKMYNESETFLQKVGIKQFEVKGNLLLVNGQLIKLKGTNRHDSDPYTGYTISREQLTIDLALMKQHNFNAIRTSHYPNAPWATQLYSKYGFYVIDEADIETHGNDMLYGGGHRNKNYKNKFVDDVTYGLLCHDKSFEESLVDRVQRLVSRDKNCACVLLWSLGNESAYGPNLEKAAAWIKSYDKDMLVHYESSIYQMEGYENDLSNLDVYSHMYADIDSTEQNFTTWMTDKPFLQCEFVHAMGNGPGDIEDYFEQIYAHDSYAGGFVWEWCDHSVYMGKTADGKDKFFYGGDWGEQLHDGNFCVDGLVYPDRTPSTGLIEWKNVARPVRAYDVDVKNGIVKIANKLDFTNLKDALTIYFEVSCNGEIVERGAVEEIDLAPHAEAEIKVNFNLPKEGKIYLRLIYKQKFDSDFVKAGDELGFDQILVFESEKVEIKREKALKISTCDLGKYIELYGENFRYVYNKFTGTFETMVKDSINILTKPMDFNIWRAPTDNDRVIRREWAKVGYDRAKTKTYSTEITEKSECVILKTSLTISAVMVQWIAKAVAVWTISNDGKINLNVEVERNTDLPFLPRFGVRLPLNNDFKNVDYKGFGPYESYCDKRRSSYYGKFSSTVCEMHEDYIKPQENGSHYGCDKVAIFGDNSYGISVFGDNFSFNVSDYTAEELTAKGHNFELEKSGSTILCLDGRMSGIGSGSCGPQLSPKYQVNDKNFTFNFDIVIGKKYE